MKNILRIFFVCIFTISIIAACAPTEEAAPV